MEPYYRPRPPTVVRCAGCGNVLSIGPGLTEFNCLNCHLTQLQFPCNCCKIIVNFPRGFPPLSCPWCNYPFAAPPPPGHHFTPPRHHFTPPPPPPPRHHIRPPPPPPPPAPVEVVHRKSQHISDQGGDNPGQAAWRHAPAPVEVVHRKSQHISDQGGDNPGQAAWRHAPAPVEVVHRKRQHVSDQGGDNPGQAAWRHAPAPVEVVHRKRQHVSDQCGDNPGQAAWRHAPAPVEGGDNPGQAARMPAPVEQTKMGTWAEEKEIKFLHKHGSHSFQVSLSLGEKDQSGVMKCIVAGVGGNKEVMSAKVFEEEELMARVKESRMYYFVPTASFREGEKIIGVGNFLGMPVNTWILKQKKDLWIFDSRGEILMAGMTFGAIIRKVAKELTCQHKKKKPMGFTCRRMYINGETFKLSKPARSSDDFKGIANDLKEFQKLVHIAAGSHVKDTALELFNRLFLKINEHGSIDSLVLDSFMICHFPLFYSFKERFKYANVYDFIRKVHKDKFDPLMRLKEGIFDVGEWWKSIPDDPCHLKLVYNNDGFSGRKNCLLLSFIRHVYHHYYEKSSASHPCSHIDAIDEELLKIFPLAFSKVYCQIYVLRSYLSRFMDLASLIAIFKAEGLDYSMDSVDI